MRQLERKWVSTGSLADESAWLLEIARTCVSLDWPTYSRLAELEPRAASQHLARRVEVGTLDSTMLELAAFCGHNPARLALDRDEKMCVDPEEAHALVAGLAAWGVEWPIRAGIAAGNLVLPHWESEFPEAAFPAQVLAATGLWADCQCNDHRVRVQSLRATGQSEWARLRSLHRQTSEEASVHYQAVDEAEAALVQAVEHGEDGKLAKMECLAANELRLSPRLQAATDAWAVIEELSAAVCDGTHHRAALAVYIAATPSHWAEGDASASILHSITEGVTPLALGGTDLFKKYSTDEDAQEI